MEMSEFKGLFDKLIKFENYDHLSERDQYHISLMKKNINKTVNKYVIHQWETWAVEQSNEKNKSLEEPIWNCKEIITELVKMYTTDILPEDVMRYYEAYIYNKVWYRDTWIWARNEYGGLNNHLYSIM